MNLYEQIVLAKKSIEESTSLNINCFNISLSSISCGESYYILQHEKNYSVTYVDERGSVTFLCKSQPLDEARYQCFKLLVKFCSLEYFKQFKKPFDRFIMFEKQLEYMKLIENRYVPILKKEIDDIVASST